MDVVEWEFKAEVGSLDGGGEVRSEIFGSASLVGGREIGCREDENVPLSRGSMCSSGIG